MNKNKFIIFILFAIGLLSRFPISEQYMSHTDASSLTLALSQYNLLQETPAPPGYPLYFAIGTFLNFFFHNPHLSLVFESALFSGIGAIAFFLFGNSLGGRRTGLTAVALFLTAPSFYFLGLTVYPYIVVIGFYVFFIYASYRVVIMKKQEWIWLGFFYGLLIGVRPQELITTLPLFVLSLYFLKKEIKIKAVALFFFITLLWVVPFLTTVGGVKKYFDISSKAATEAIPLPSLTRFLNKKFELLSGLYLTLTVGPFFLVLYGVKNLFFSIPRKTVSLSWTLVVFSCVWVLPILAFNLFVRTEHVGYQAGYLIFLLFAIAWVMPKLFKKNTSLFIVVSCIAVINLWIFFQDRDPDYNQPYRQSSFHYSDIRRNDYELSNKISFIKKNFLPKKTIIIAGPFFWRHARYYLPDYLIYEIDALWQNSKGSYIRRDAKNLLYKSYESRTYSFEVPSGFDTIILFDNEMDRWVVGDKKVIGFKGISKITILKVKAGDTIKYSYHRLEVFGQ